MVIAETNIARSLLGDGALYDAWNWVGAARLANLTPLSEMYSLRMLGLGGNPVTDFSSLVHLYETTTNSMCE